MTPEFVLHIYRDDEGEWRWRAVADNGKRLANGGEGYQHKADMMGTLTMLFGAERVALLVREVAT